MGHFDPSFNNIEGVLHDIQKNLKEEYDDIELHMVGGFVHNVSFIALLDILSSSYSIYLKERVHNHVLKPYNVIISKQGASVY